MADDIDLTVRPGETLRALATSTLRREISEGRLPPGTRLVERDLCDALGVSRTVIREAIRHLEALGYVTEVPRRGPIVALLDRDTVRSIYEIRTTLEAQAASLFVQRATKADRDALRKCLANIVALEKSDDRTAVLAATEEFGRLIRQGSGNPLFDTVMTPLSGRTHVIRMRAAMSAERRPKALRQLKELARALLGDDPEAASDAARRRMSSAADFALKALAEI